MPIRLATVVSGLICAEGLRWREGRIWFSDLDTCKVQSAREDGSDLRVEAIVSHQPRGFDWLPDGRLLIVSLTDRALLRRERNGELVLHADLSARIDGGLGDVVVDKRGRAYISAFGGNASAGEMLQRGMIHRVDPNGAVTPVADELWFPNGCVISGDSVMLISEKFGDRVTAFDLTDSGRLINRRIWASFGPVPTSLMADEALQEVAVAPDGGSLDAYGALWIADIRNERLLRILSGQIVESIQLGSYVYDCALGGADGRTLFFCAATHFDISARKTVRGSNIVALRVGVPAAETRRRALRGKDDVGRPSIAILP